MEVCFCQRSPSCLESDANLRSAVALLRGILLLRRWAAIAILLGRRALIVILLSWIVRHGWRLVGMRACLVTVYGAVELVLGAYTQ